jgi:hypothetical protein
VLDSLAIDKDEDEKAAMEGGHHHHHPAAEGSSSAAFQVSGGQRQVSRRWQSVDNGNVPGVGTCALNYAQPLLRDENGEKCVAGIHQTIAQGFYRVKGYIAQRLFAPRPQTNLHQQQK